MSAIRVYNKTLCPELWTSDLKLDPIVRRNLLQLAKDFYEKAEFKAPVLDIYFMGSAANYNWTPDSDVDVHILIDFSQLQMPTETAHQSVRAASSLWNEEHDIKIKNHNVEINIQDRADNKPHVTGIFSLVKNTWVRTPKKSNININKVAIVSTYTRLKNNVENAIRIGDRDYLKSVKEYINAYRQYGLDTKGELSTENLVFKILRSRGIIKNLNAAINKLYDLKMSVQEVVAACHAEAKLHEVTQQNIKAVHPTNPALYNKKTHNWDLENLTLDNLKALRDKMGRFWRYAVDNNKDTSEMESALNDYQKYNSEIKRRMTYINSPIKEGSYASYPADAKFGLGAIGANNDVQFKEFTRNTFADQWHGRGNNPWGRRRFRYKNGVVEWSDYNVADEEQKHLVNTYLERRGFPVIKHVSEFDGKVMEKAQTDEGYGAGIPEEDRLNIPKHRWQIKSKTAPKTPKMVKEGLEERREKIKGQVYHVNIGDVAWFEYRCYEGHDSADATLWYKSHQQVKVLRRVETGYGATPRERGENGHPAVYHVKFKDGSDFDVTEDELLYSPSEYVRPDPPLPQRQIEGFDPTSAGPNPQATEGQPPDPNFYQDNINRMRAMEESDQPTNDFKSWFGDSKVVDSSGKPLKMFHGTGNVFKSFDKSRNWFTSDPSVAGEYAKDAAYHRYSTKGNANIIPVYLSIQNPKVYSPPDNIAWHEAMKDWAMTTTDSQLESQGHDGVIFKYRGIIIAYPFKSNQIKSIFNRTSWDKNTDDISKENIESSRISLKELLLLRESMDVYIDGYKPDKKVNKIDEVIPYLMDKIIIPAYQAMPADQQNYFNKNKSLPSIYDVLVPDGSYYEQSDYKRGILNFYISGYTSKTTQHILKQLLREFKSLNITVGKLKRENSGMFKSQVIRIPVVINSESQNSGPPELNLSNRNMYHIFKEILQFEPDDESGSSFSVDAQEVISRIESLQGDPNWIKTNQIEPTHTQHTPVVPGDEWKNSDDDSDDDTTDNPHDKIANSIGNALGANIIRMGLDEEGITGRLSVILEIAKWAVQHGYSNLYVA